MHKKIIYTFYYVYILIWLIEIILQTHSIMFIEFPLQ